MAQNKEQVIIAESPEDKTILLVEDDIGIGEMLVQAIVQETPYHALLVADGFEALQAVSGVRPSLFILDYHLPRMNGIELYDRLHALNEFTQTPAIMMSARLPRQELSQRNILGMNKPIDLDDFLQVIDRLLA